MRLSRIQARRTTTQHTRNPEFARTLNNFLKESQNPDKTTESLTNTLRKVRKDLIVILDAGDKQCFIQDMADLNFLSRLISYLDISKIGMAPYSDLISEASWVMHLATSSADEMILLAEVSKYEIIQVLIQLLSANDETVLGNAIWSLGNLIVNNEAFKQYFLDKDLFNKITLQVENIEKQSNGNVSLLLSSYYNFLYNFLITPPALLKQETLLEILAWLTKSFMVGKAFCSDYFPHMITCIKQLLKMCERGTLLKFHELEGISEFTRYVMELVNIENFGHSCGLLEIMIELTHKIKEHMRAIISQPGFQAYFLPILRNSELQRKGIALLNNLFVDSYFLDSLEKNQHQIVIFELFTIFGEVFKRYDDEIAVMVCLNTMKTLLFECNHEYIIDYILQNPGMFEGDFCYMDILNFAEL